MKSISTRMAITDSMRSIYRRYFLGNVRLYGYFNSLYYSKSSRFSNILGTRLFINPQKEPSYLRASRVQAKSHVFRHEVPDIITFASLIRPGSTFVDCGANVGLWSAAMARLTPLHPGLRIMAFEANSDTFTRLVKTCEIYRNVECVNIALSDRETEMEMAEGGASLVFGVKGNLYNANGRVHRVTAAPLQKYIGDLWDILMKVDVEGHEYEVLLGARRAIEEGRVRAIMIDGFPDHRADRIISLLRSGGFDIFDIKDLSPYVGGTDPILAVRHAG